MEYTLICKFICLFNNTRQPYIHTYIHTDSTILTDKRYDVIIITNRLTGRFGNEIIMKIKRKDISQERRKEILNAAKELFSKSGYHGVSVDAIARKAGISKGNLYWHFKSKQEIFLQLFEYLSLPLFMPLMQLFEEDLLPREKLTAMSRACLETAEANPEIVRFAWQIAAQPELKEMFTSEYTEWMDPFVDKLVPLFAALGEKKPDDVARFYALTIDAFMGITVMMPEAFDKEKILVLVEERFINFTGVDDDQNR